MPWTRWPARRVIPMAEGGIRWDAEAYARHSEAQLGWARELIGKLALDGNESVLDIGCGDGKVTAEIARLRSRGRGGRASTAPTPW